MLLTCCINLPRVFNVSPNTAGQKWSEILYNICACSLLLNICRRYPDERERPRVKVVEVYGAIGKMLKTYTAGKLPKAFKIIPSLTNWEQVGGGSVQLCANLLHPFLILPLSLFYPSFTCPLSLLRPSFTPLLSSFFHRSFTPASSFIYPSFTALPSLLYPPPLPFFHPSLMRALSLIHPSFIPLFPRRALPLVQFVLYSVVGAERDICCIVVSHLWYRCDLFCGIVESLPHLG